MNAYMRKVVSFETKSEHNSRVLKQKTTDYANGGVRTVTVTETEVYTRPVANLECGHTRDVKRSDLGKKRMACYECEWWDKNGTTAV